MKILGLAVVMAVATLPLRAAQLQPVTVNCLMSGMKSDLGDVYWRLTLDESRGIVVRRISSSGRVERFKAQYFPTNVFWIDMFGIENSLNRSSGALTKTVGKTTTTDLCKVIDSDGANS